MRILALILVLLSGVVGFVLSYGIAYREVSGILYSTESVQSSSSSSFNSAR